MSPLIPRRNRDVLRAAQTEANDALRISVEGLHAEVLQTGIANKNRTETHRIALRMMHWQDRNHFAENFRRALGEAR